MFCLDHPLAARGLIRATTTCSVHPFARVGEQAGGRVYQNNTLLTQHQSRTRRQLRRDSCCKLRSSSNTVLETNTKPQQENALCSQSAECRPLVFEGWQADYAKLPRK
jgi:hypothetical protein